MSFTFALQVAALAAGIFGSRAPGIEQSKVESVVNERTVALSLCYEDARKRDPKLEGNVSVEMDVSETGLVLDAKSRQGTTLRDKEAVSCVVGVMKQLDFGKQDKPQTVRYTLRFAEEKKEN